MESLRHDLGLACVFVCGQSSDRRDRRRNWRRRWILSSSPYSALVSSGAVAAFAMILIVTAIQTLLARRHMNASNPEAPLLVSADEDADIMELRLQFYTHLNVLGEPKLTGTAPFIEFLQPMINVSVLLITFDSEIEGKIRIDGEEQKDKLEICHTSPQSLEVRRAAFHDLTFRQWLTPEVAKKMQEQVETVFDFGHTATTFSFRHRGQKRTIRKAIGNQLIWKNTDRQISELLADANSHEIRDKVGRAPIELRFEYHAPFVQMTPVTDGPLSMRVYIRLFPECSQPVQNCTGHLLRIMRKVDERWEPTAFNEAVPLTWANRNAGPITVEPNVGPYLDVFYVGNEGQCIVPCIAPIANDGLPLRMVTPHNRAMFVNRDQWFRFDVQVTNSKPIFLKVRLGDRWDHPTVEVLPKGNSN